jgi:glutamine amidotransferase|tara:strand:+ start:2009 stop:2623 length:615 start_codon:yes stop_codon:yes gene_type:complete
MKVVIIDYGIGNINSIVGALSKLGVNYEFSRDHEVIKKADKIILPGVGSFLHGMNNLKKFNLVDVLSEEVMNKNKPILGICLGMQLFCKLSEENKVEVNGLGWLNASVKKFPKDCKIIPHMGWNVIETKNNSQFYKKNTSLDFYFVHSYYVSFNKLEKNIIIEKSNYNIDFPAIIIKDNIFGVQFHPEKSQKDGLEFLRMFVNA